ncbi:sodium-dependent glucose transporter 1A-like [Ptychodera flava]|uniref:sodium-dependent glucose transporter 1A-like n=1 Tax=Ptychodera flava TaxID=63121 RepID=UPI003969E354
MEGSKPTQEKMAFEEDNGKDEGRITEDLLHSKKGEAYIHDQAADNFKRHRIITTIACYGSFIGLGACIAILGVSLIDFQYQVRISLQETTYIFMARCVGYVIGSFAGGACLDNFDNMLVMGLCLLGVSTSGFIISFCSGFAMLLVFVAWWGFFLGILETGGNFVCVRIWGEDSEPRIQGLHFFFAVGSTLVPLVSSPFLSEPIRATEHNVSGSLATSLSGRENGSMFSGDVISSSLLTTTEYFSLDEAADNDVNATPLEGRGLLWVPYTMISILYLVVALLFFWLFMQGPRRLVIERSTSTVERHQESPSTNVSVLFRVTLIVLLFLFSLLYIGHEVLYGGFLYVFAVESDFGFSVQRATYLSSAFWGSFACARGFGVLCAAYVSPKVMLLIDCLGMCSASILLSIFADEVEAVLWGASILLGISMGSVFPSVISWGDRYIELTGKLMSTFVIAAAMADGIFPFMFGILQKSFGMMVLMYMTLSMSTTLIVIFCVMQTVASCHGGERDRSKNILYTPPAAIELSERL